MHILVVDDDHDLRSFMLDILRQRGYDVGEAFDYDSAILRLRRQPYDLVLLDITLPGRSGLDVLEFVRQHRPACPVIIVTGTSGLDLAIRSMTLGARDYITKPCSPNYLLHSVEHALAHQHP